MNHAHFTDALEKWFARSQRPLPWREPENARDPYRVFVSEVMLQQTTVASVIPFYLRFLERFPDASTLAAANIDQVLPLWAGLGYYSRARNLHAAAQVVIDKHAGVFPETHEDVLALPGVGRYTAGAICSIAFNQQVPIVDANVARVLARVLCIEDDVKSRAASTRLWQEATTLVEASERPSQFNPAMMELGALICTPKNPRCELCPVAAACCGFKSGRQNELPRTARKKVPKQVHDVCVFVGDTHRVLLRQRNADNTERSWWRGMWELPRTTIGEGENAYTTVKRLLKQLGVAAKPGPKVHTLRHTVTDHSITLDCYAMESAFDAHEGSTISGAQFFDWADIEGLAIPATMSKLLSWLQTNHVTNAQLALL